MCQSVYMRECVVSVCEHGGQEWPEIQGGGLPKPCEKHEYVFHFMNYFMLSTCSKQGHKLH